MKIQEFARYVQLIVISVSQVPTVPIAELDTIHYPQEVLLFVLNAPQQDV